MKITKKQLTDTIRTLRERKAPAIDLPGWGGEYYIIQCTADQAVEVVEIMRKSKRPIPLLIKVQP